MDLTSVLWDILKNPKTIETISKKTWLSGDNTKQAIAKALPSILEQLEKNTQDKTKLEWLKKAIETKHSWDVLENIWEKLDLSDWTKIISHIFWNNLSSIEKKVWNKEILSALGPIVMWALWKTSKAKWWDISSIIWVLTWSSKNSNILVAFLDKNWDWKIQDDLIRIFINWIKKFFVKK